MRRLLTILGLSLLAPLASASPDIAALWGDQARELEEQTAAIVLEMDQGLKVSLSDQYVLNVSRFGRTAASLAKWIDTSNGPRDLSCIFRGMATESEDQTLELLEQPEMPAARAHLERLKGMFSDAQLIAQAAKVQAPMPTLQQSTEKACPMELELARRALQN